MTTILRPATPDDAIDMAKLADIAAEGLPSSIWATMGSAQESALDVGARIAAKSDGTFSWRNATIATVDGETAGMMISYVTASEEEPLSEDMHPSLRPLVVLENQALETRYVSLLATFQEFRCKGIAHILMAEAEKSPGKNGMSLITTDKNVTGRKLYASMGYREVAQAPVIKTNWDTACDNWYLLCKP